MKRVITNIFLFFLTLITVSLLALPIWFDLIFSIFILFILKKNFTSVVILNLFILIMVLIIDLNFGKNEKHGYFYRAHDKYKTKQKIYQKNVSDIIFMQHGDLYYLDGGLSKKRDLIKEPRKQQFITDSYGFRNNITEIEDAEVILVGDSFIVGVGTTQKHIPSNILSEISGKKVASLSYNGLKPKEYESMINKYLNIIKQDAQIFIFYFEGNDFTKQNKLTYNKMISPLKNMYWISLKIRFAYERLERNKDKFLLKILSDKNYFLRNIRAKSHLINRKIFSKFYKNKSPIKYYKIGNKTVGFYYNGNSEIDSEYTTYIIKNNRVLNRISGIFFIPTKLRIYSDHINLISQDSNNKLKYLNDAYSELNKTVYDLSEKMKPLTIKYLSEGKYLYWRDDTHWNHYGIFEAMTYVNSVIKK